MRDMMEEIRKVSTTEQANSEGTGMPKVGLVRALRSEVGEPSVRGIIPTLAVCGFIFMILGAMTVVLSGAGFSASALVASPSSTSQFGTLGATSNASEVAQTELVYAGIAAPIMSAAVSAKTGIANPPPVSVSIEPGTTILQFQATGTTAELAALSANTSAEAYVSWWRERASAAALAQLQVVNAQIVKDPTSGDLKRLQSGLQLQLATIQAEQRILDEATAEGATKTSSVISAAILGGFVGILVGTGVILFVRQRNQPTHKGDESSG